MARKKHKNRKRTNGYLERNMPTQRQRKTFLIVCEGQTEKSYFDKFIIPSVNIKAKETGRSTVSIIKEAIELRKSNEYDQVWCVFDKDDNKDLNNAIKMAQSNGIKVAYSNQAFEYWLLLHFNDHQGANLDRALYAKSLNVFLKPLGEKYESRSRGAKRKGKFISQNLFDILQQENRQQLAIKRAKRLNTKIHLNKQPSDTESNTTVYLLVSELLKQL